MPDISDLLRDAVPPPRDYDEGDVRRRIARRRRARRGGIAAVLAAMVIGAIGMIVAQQQDDEGGVVASSPTTTGRWSAYGATAVAIVGDEIWIGGDGFVSRGDGTDRIEVPGAVTGMVAGDVLWVHGDRWVVAVDTTTTRALGRWDGGEVGDVEALPSQEAAISQPSSDEVAIVRTAAEGLEEVWRIPVRTRPRDLVRTTGGDLWVTCGDGISELDVGAQGVKRFEQWTGRLLAPSLSGGIWTNEGARTIDLHPDELDAGLSVAEGARYDVVATMVVETSYGLFVGEPTGVFRYGREGSERQVIYSAPSKAESPAALAVSGGQVVYIVAGEVRLGMAAADATTRP